MKRNLSFFVFVTFFTVSFFILSTFAYGGVNYSGDIDPANPSSWDNSTNAYIGKTGTGSLSITNGGNVTNGSGCIGYYYGSQGDVAIDGAGSSWENSGSLYVGNKSNGSLSITNGGNVTSGSVHIGYKAGSVGTATVDGVDSSWQSSGWLFVGNEGSGSLSITGGGHVTSNYGRIGYLSGSQGSVVVDGVDSSWQSLGVLYVGNKGSASLSITNGGNVTSDHGYIGYYSGSQGSVVVDGVDSSWQSCDNLLVGNEGSGSLSITNGGMVTVDGETRVNTGSGDGIINFDGGTLTTKSLLAKTEDLKGTGTINTNALIADVDLVFDSTHGPSQTFVINNSSQQNITTNLDIDGSGYLGVGYFGSGSMSIAEGISIASTDGYIGYKANSVGSAVVDGIGSSWENSGSLYVGRYGSGSLSITNDSHVTTSYYGNIGYKAGSQGSVIVDGVGSSLESSRDLYVGNEGSGSLSITNGGNVTDDDGNIGYSSGSVGSAVVDGVGSSWRNSHSIYIGRYGSGSLSIVNGGYVRSYRGCIGEFSGSQGSVIVDGIGSSWENSYSLYVGKDGSGSLSIINGGHVRSNRSYIGYNSISQGSVIVDGVGSSWESCHDLFVGRYGIGSLSITNGSIVIVDQELEISTNTNSFVEISTGGMLALRGHADSSIADFLGLVQGSDDIRFWDESINDWSNIINASIGEDFTLEYISDASDNLYGHTVLTVTAIPEPITMMLFALGCLEIRRRKACAA